MNIIQIMGNLGAEPETRFTASGQKVTSLRLASNSKKGGKDETTWWKVTIWGDRFDKMMPYLKKGSSLIVVGEMSMNMYTDKEGRQQASLEVNAEFLRFSPFGKPDSAKQDGQAQGQNSYGQQNKSEQPYAGQSQTSYGQNSAPSMSQTADDDQIPF